VHVRVCMYVCMCEHAVVTAEDFMCRSVCVCVCEYMYVWTCCFD
jgi:hypothetical protein